MNTIQIMLLWCFGSTHVKKAFAQLSGYWVRRVRVAPLPFCWCTFFVVSIRSCFLQRSAKDKSLLRCIIYKNNSRMCYSICTLCLLIREYIYSLGLKLGSTLPPHLFRRAYIYSIEKIIIWSPEYKAIIRAMPTTLCFPA